jgi:hypothetical protein
VKISTRAFAALSSSLKFLDHLPLGLYLAVWFGPHVIFPSPGTVDWFAILVGIVAFVGMDTDD